MQFAKGPAAFTIIYLMAIMGQDKFDEMWNSFLYELQTEEVYSERCKGILDNLIFNNEFIPEFIVDRGDGIYQLIR